MVQKVSVQNVDAVLIQEQEQQLVLIAQQVNMLLVMEIVHVQMLQQDLMLVE